MELSRGIEVRKWVSMGPDRHEITSRYEAPAGSVMLQAYSGDTAVSFIHAVPEKIAYPQVVKLAQAVLRTKARIFPVDFEKLKK